MNDKFGIVTSVGTQPFFAINLIAKIESNAARLATLNSPLRCPSEMSNYHQNTATVFSIDQHWYSHSKRIYI
jgi:hypothetical protein